MIISNTSELLNVMFILLCEMGIVVFKKYKNEVFLGAMGTGAK